MGQTCKHHGTQNHALLRWQRPAQTRWITIGTVRHKYVNIRNCGFPGGLSMRWTGRVDWCQPDAFLRWEELIAAIRIRLGIADLEMIAVACGVLREYSEEYEILCLVKRQNLITDYVIGN